MMIIKNLGPIKRLKIHLNKETILLGKNNTGKTYVSYILYGTYKKLESLKEEIFREYILKKIETNQSSFSFSIEKEEIINFFKRKALKKLNTMIKDELPKIFNLQHDDFIETNIEIEEVDLGFITSLAKNKHINTQVRRLNFNPRMLGSLNVTSTGETWDFSLENISSFSADNGIEEDIISRKDDIWNFFVRVAITYLAKGIFSTPNIIYIPAERNGINVFRNELNIKRSSSSFDLENDKDMHTNTYPLPISDYMKYLNQLNYPKNGTLIKPLTQQDSDRERLWNDFSENILKGKYEFQSDTNEYYYRELFSVKKDGKLNFRKMKIPLQISSSSIKSLFGLEYYLKYTLQSGDIIFIDEPEMNLDPENQVKMAKLLARLAELGVRVVISTHSDYLTRATANYLLKSRLNSTEGSTENKLLETDVSAYFFDRNNIEPIEEFSTATYISNFDDVNISLENEYFEVINRLEDLED